MDLREEIEKVAYELYERDGRTEGKDLEHWLEAERIVRERNGPRKAAKSSPSSAKKAPAKKAAKK